MKVLIIEDEQLTAEDLSEILMEMPDGISVEKILGSVAEAIEYLTKEPEPDLIFCDIQLGDGHSFEIFKQVKTKIPVVFCTAYDEYALEAFKNNGIDYILKPFSKKDIREAVLKFKQLQLTLSKPITDFDALFKSLNANTIHGPKTSSLLVNFKDKIIPIKIADIALFGIEHKNTLLITFSNQKYFINQTLEELEQICGDNFYRANRQYLINREVVTEVLQYFARKLLLKLKIESKHEIVISKTKIPEFLSWLRR
jgi:two-component system, LytTR family, response regulator LytT